MSIVLGPFWSYVDKTGDCWLWKGYIDHYGYGMYGHKRAHVMSWEEANGRKVDEGKELHHRATCPKNCINQDHLIEVTRKEHKSLEINYNTAKTHCIKGHEFTTENTMWQVSSRSGNPYRVCRACIKERQNAKYRRLR